MKEIVFGLNNPFLDLEPEAIQVFDFKSIDYIKELKFLGIKIILPNNEPLVFLLERPANLNKPTIPPYAFNDWRIIFTSCSIDVITAEDSQGPLTSLEYIYNTYTTLFYDNIDSEDISSDSLRAFMYDDKQEFLEDNFEFVI
jgi:hypothetical protein